MSLSLSELFAQHQSQNSSKEESHEFEENGGNEGSDGSIGILLTDSNETRNQSITSPERKKSKKRSRSPRKSDHDTADDNNDLTSKPKRIKSESSNDDVKDEIEDEIDEMEDYGDEEEDDGNTKRASNQKFYQNYSESMRVLYKEQEPKRNSKKTLEVVNSALCPPKNERRLPGEDVPSRSLAGRYKPRKKRIQGSSGNTEVSYRLETQDEIQDRVRRMEGYAQRDALRVRWKNRTVDFQSEKDVGDAFWLRAQETLGDKLRSDEKERRMRNKRLKKKELKKEKRVEMERIKEMERNDVLEEDDEVKEQSQLLAQLTQPEIALKQEEDPDHRMNNEVSNESSQKLNYWELGYTMPSRSSINFDFDPSVEKIVQRRSMGTVDTNTNNDSRSKDETRASFTALMKKRDDGESSSRFYFEPNRALISNGKSTFRPGYRSGHIQQLLNMAARSLCGDGGSGSINDIELENQYIRLLCKQHEDETRKNRHYDSTIGADFRKKGFMMTLAEEQGKNMLLYLQNIWDNPRQVAMELGLMDCSQESPIRGNLLTSIKEHSRNKRLQIKKLHRMRPVDWSYENNYDDDSDSGNEDNFGKDAADQIDDKVVGEAITNGGVVDAMTMETSLTIDQKRIYGDSNNDRDALISPTTFYSHIAGTNPPIPQHPFDPSAWIFGPVDRHSKFYHTSVRMDTSIYKIVLATLMKRIGRARFTKHDSISRDTQEQITNLIEEFATVNENKFYLQYTNIIQDPFDSDIPLVEFYRGVNEYCSFMANGFLEMQQEPKKDPDNDDENNLDDELDDLHKGSGMNIIAGKIWEFCQPKIRQNSLLRFPKLRIVFGIALICRSINSSAAEILSRPIDGNCIETPLDLFKEALEDMESKKYIAMSRNFEENSIRAVELEFLLHDAAEFFQEAVELDPTNVEYQLWHIGCLASCLLISSGNKICSNSAHLYPSQMKGTFMDSATLTHEVRPRMKKYKEVRVELATAVKALFALVKYQDSSRAHFGVFSLLEWKQVVGLLVGSQLKTHLKDIHRCHAFNFGKWAHREPTAFLREYKGITENICHASLHAEVLENDPGDVGNWRNFVLSLGPIPEAKDEDWWGKHRSWWGESLLHLTSPDRIGTFGDESALEYLLENLNDEIVEDLPTKVKETTDSLSIPSNTSFIKTQEDDDTDDNQILAWLPTPESVMMEDDEQGKISEEQRARCYANDLPKIEKHIYDNTDGSRLEEPLLQGLSSVSKEVQAYKIFISCHLLGVNDPSVGKFIYSNLLHNCIRSGNAADTVDKNCDDFRILVWLNSMNINITKIVHSMQSML